jgi:hypothetical protein
MYCSQIVASLFVAAILLCSCAASVDSSRYSVGTSGEVETPSTAAGEGVHGDRRALERRVLRSLGQRLLEKAPPPPKPNKSFGARTQPLAPPPPCIPAVDDRLG